MKKTEGFYTVKSGSIYNSFFARTSDVDIPALRALQLKYKTPKEKTLPSKDLALRRAAHQGNIEDIEYLINDYNADVKSKSKNGFTALDWAYFYGHMSAVNTLCWLGAEQSVLEPLLLKYVTNAESEWPIKDIALSRAAATGNYNDVLLLVKTYEADIHSQVNDKTPLELASSNGHANIVKFLEERLEQELLEVLKL